MTLRTKLVFSLLIIFILLGTFFPTVFHQAQQAYASAITTNTDTKKDQVITKQDDGVLYLTTTVAQPADYKPENVYRKNRSQSSGILGSMFQIPTGFATDVAQLFNAILSLVMVIATLLVFFYLVMGAFEWITSGGDKGKIDQARSKMFAAIVGLLIVASSYAIFMVVLQFLGFKDFADVIQNVNTLSGQPLATDSATLNTNASESAKTATNSANTNLKGLL